MDNNSFWGRVQRLLKARKIGRGQFAEKIGVSLRTLERWIHDDQTTGVYTAYSMARALGVSLEYLVSGKNRDAFDKRLKEFAATQTLDRIATLVQKIQDEANRVNTQKRGA